MYMKFRKPIALITALIMTLSFAGCGSNEDKNSGEVVSNLGDTYPLNTDAKLTWATWTASHSDYLDYEKQPFFKGLIEQTGVDIDFKFEVVGEAFNLMLASGNLPDVIQYDWYGVKGIFTNNNYEIFDIQTGDGSVITDYSGMQGWDWNMRYYNNLKERIDVFID